MSKPKEPAFDDGRLRELINQLYDVHQNKHEIAPSWLATEAMLVLDPEKRAPVRVYIGCNLHCRQIAREVCRKPQEDGEQHPLWPDLQRRYPKAHKSEQQQEPVYILLEYLSYEDVLFNVKRLNKEASAKRKHAKDLMQWWRQKPQEESDTA